MALSLPVLEPLTPSKLENLCNISMSVLYCAISQAAACAVFTMSVILTPKGTVAQTQSNFKDEDLDANSITLVEKALNLYNYIGLTIQNSTRAGGHVYQNHLLAGAWVLISGLQSYLNVSLNIGEKTTHLKDRDDKGRSPSKSRETGSARTSLLKFQQSFGVLSVALASRFLSLMSDLFDDLNLEVCAGSGSIVQVRNFINIFYIFSNSHIFLGGGCRRYNDGSIYSATESR